MELLFENLTQHRGGSVVAWFPASGSELQVVQEAAVGRAEQLKWGASVLRLLTAWCLCCAVLYCLTVAAAAGLCCCCCCWPPAAARAAPHCRKLPVLPAWAQQQGGCW